MQSIRIKYFIATISLFLCGIFQREFSLFAQPVITTQPMSLTTCTTSTAMFCVTTSTGGTTYQWKMSSAPGGPYVNVANGTPNTFVYSGATSNCLTITTTSICAIYYYECVLTSGSSTTSNTVSMLYVAGTGCGTGIKTYGSSNASFYVDQAFGLVEATDGGLVMVGESVGVDPTGAADAVVVKIATTNNGALSWGRGLGTNDASNWENWNAITKNTSGNYVVTGRGFNNGSLRADYDMIIGEFPYTGGAATWKKYIGKSTDEEWGNAIIQHSNGDYYTAGHSMEYDASLGADYEQWYTGRFTVGTGAVSWTRHMGNGNAIGTCANEEAYGLVETGSGVTSGDLLVVGYTSSGTNEDIGIMRQTNTGTVSSWRTLGGSGNERATCIKKAAIGSNAGKYVIAGYSSTAVAGAAGGYDFYIALLNDDATNTIAWQKMIGTSGNDYGQAVTETSDGGFAIAGYTGNASGASKAYIVKVSSTGTLVWTRTIDVAASDADVLYSIVEMSDGNLGMVGFTKADPESDILFIALDASGNITSSCTSTTGGTLVTPSLSYSSPSSNNANASAVTGSPTVQQESISTWLLASTCGVVILPVELTDFTAKCTATGKKINWTTLTEQNNKEFVVEHSKNGKVWEELGVVKGAGTSISRNNYSESYEEKSTDYKYYRLRQIDYNGNVFDSDVITSNCIERNNVVANIYPNPSNNEVNVDIQDDISGNIHVQLYDVTGRVVIDQTHFISKEEPGIKMYLSELENGIYYLKASSEGSGYSFTGKIMKK